MTVSVGLRAEAAVVVDQHNTALAMGGGNVPAFATSALVALIERAASNALHRHLEEGEDSVGVAVSVRHLAPTPVGKRVRAEAEVTAVEGRRITFMLRAFDAVEKVGEGTHQRIVVNREDFIWKMATKGA